MLVRRKGIILCSAELASLGKFEDLLRRPVHLVSFLARGRSSPAFCFASLLSRVLSGGARVFPRGLAEDHAKPITWPTFSEFELRDLYVLAILFPMAQWPYGRVRFVQCHVFLDKSRGTSLGCCAAWQILKVPSRVTKAKNSRRMSGHGCCRAQQGATYK